MATKPRTTKPREFAFEITSGVTVPAEALARRGSAPELPFKATMVGMKAGDHFFLPEAFWTLSAEEGGRGVEAAKCTPAYQKQKVQDAWKALSAKDENKERMGKLACVKVFREVGDKMGDHTFKERGVSVFCVSAA